VAKRGKDKSLYKIAVKGFVLAGCLFLIFSCISFNIADKPSVFVHPNNQSALNWCGMAGAFCSYYLLYYIGPGVFVLLLSVISFVLTDMFGANITQPVLRSVGMGLLAASVSVTVYILWPIGENSFPMGNGGILGIGAAVFLEKHVALLGTAIILLSAWAVGAMLLADSFVIKMLGLFGLSFQKLFGSFMPAFSVAKKQSLVLGDIWQKLSERQKVSRPSTASELSAELDNHLEGLSQGEDEEAITVERRPEQKGPLKVTMPNVRKPKPYVPKSYDDYTLPGMDLLSEPEYGYVDVQERIVKSQAKVLERLLSEFNINADVVNAEPGPVITMFELELAPGIKVSQITNLANDMARGLGAQAVRVVAPLPGRHTIGIEVPNSQKEIVRIKDLIQRAGSAPEKMRIPLFLGKDSSGEALVSDLATMPHLLIAGTTGSGKSVCINTIIASVLLTKRPDEVKLILIDPKMVEMTAFANIPHLMCPIVTENKRAEQILEWATTKMDERYAILAEAGVKNITAFNKLGAEEVIRRFDPSTAEEEAKIPKKLPSLVIIVDELADLMMTAPKEIETYIVRLAQKSRAVGIHIILATQRPQATVVTGLIKSNLPSRVAFRVAAKMDSRIILDQNGAETLLGQGDMLFLKPGTSDLVRAQGAYVDDNEIKGIVDHLKSVAEPQFHPELMQLNSIDISEIGKDDMFDEAVRLVLETKRGSVSLLQRKLGIGYARASRIIEMMAVSGILGEYKGSQAREVMMTLSEYEQVCRQMEADEAAGYSDMQPTVEFDDYAKEDDNEEDDANEDEWEDEEGGDDEEYEDAEEYEEVKDE